MKIKYLGISGLYFDDGQNSVLFDACLTRPSLRRVIFSRIATDKRQVDQILAAAGITGIDHIFISHSHYDHALDLAYLAKKFNSHIYGSSSTLNIARGVMIDEKQMTSFKPGYVYRFGHFKITVLKSRHSKPFFFNNDLGQKITASLKQPAWAWQYKEGGSYDFLVQNQGQSYLIRPSFAYVPKELENVQAEYLFQGITTLSKENQTYQERFFEETIERVNPKVVVPLHWDNFTRPLNRSTAYLSFAKKSMELLAEYCRFKKIEFLFMPPLSGMDV